MTQKAKMILIGIAAVAVLVVVFNLLPDGIRIASTISAGVGFVAGIAAKVWYDHETKEEEPSC